MSRIEVWADDLEQRRLPPICAKTGVPADTELEVDFMSSPVGMLWLLFLGAILGLLMLSFAGPVFGIRGFEFDVQGGAYGPTYRYVSLRGVHPSFVAAVVTAETAGQLGPRGVELPVELIRSTT